MKKQVYLDAMGISLWSSKDSRERIVVLTDDVKMTTNSELVKQVLSLLKISYEDCHFVTKAQLSDKVVWDMRLMNRPHKSGILYSEPLAKLQHNAKGKSILWQQLWQNFTLSLSSAALPKQGM